MVKNKFMVVVSLCAIVAFGLWRGLRTDPHLINSPLIGKPVPAFFLSTLQNPNDILSRDIFKGHVTLLNVFASWCGACRYEHSVLMEIAKQYHMKIIGLNYRDSRQAALKWITNSGNPYQDIIFDPKGSLVIDLGVYGTPETFVIDSKGIIRYKYTGPIDMDTWNNDLYPLIQKLEHA